MSAKIAYIAGEYPLVSLTFIQREIAALRKHGLDVITCSMRRTPSEQHKGPAEQEAAATTYYVIEQMKNPLRLLAAQRPLVATPRAYLRALRLAWKSRAPGLKAALYQAIYFLEATILIRHLRAEGVTHMHSHFTTGSTTVAMLASEMSGIPYSFTLHGPADFFEPLRWKIGEKAARARFVATISNYARAQLMFFTDPAHWDRIHIIHCGVDPDRYAAGNAPERDTCELVFVGRIAPVKGLRLLLQAVRDLAEELPHLRLTIVGDGPDRARIEAAAAPLGDRVRFTGYLSQDEVVDVLKTADIFVLPSFAEGVPVCLMEAFATMRPVIATQVAGVGELVENGDSGLLVPPGNPALLTEAIRKLANDPALRTAMGTAGRARVAAEFDIDIEATRLATLFFGEGDGMLRPAPRQHSG